MLAPLAPHIAEEMWEALGHARTLAYEPWPTHDPALTREDTVEIVVQLDGKMRSRITLPADSQAQTIGSQRVRTDHRPSRQTGGETVEGDCRTERQIGAAVRAPSTLPSGSLRAASCRRALNGRWYCHMWANVRHALKRAQSCGGIFTAIRTGYEVSMKETDQSKPLRDNLLVL